MLSAHTSTWLLRYTALAVSQVCESDSAPLEETVDYHERSAQFTSSMTTGARAKRMLTNHTMEFLAATSFYMGPDGKWKGASQSFDSLSMSNLFNTNHVHVPDPLPTGWSWLFRGGQVTGAGDLAVRIDKWKFTWSSMPVQIDCTVIEIPRGATMVIGSRVMVADQDGLAMMLDLSNCRCYIVKIHLTVRLDWLPSIWARLLLDPININNITMVYTFPAVSGQCIELNAPQLLRP